MKKSYLEIHTEWIEGQRKAGRAIGGYLCPHCERVVEAILPTELEEPFDSMATCPHCMGLYFYRIWSNGSAHCGAVNNEPRPAPTAARATESPRNTAMMQAVLCCLSEHGKSMTSAEIANAMRSDLHAVQLAIALLVVDDKLVAGPGAGRRPAYRPKVSPQELIARAEAQRRGEEKYGAALRINDKNEVTHHDH